MAQKGVEANLPIRAYVTVYSDNIIFLQLKMFVGEIRKPYILLAMAIFSAVLRLYPDSPLTLFRILMPISILVIGKTCSRFLSKLISLSLFFVVLSFVQNYLTCSCLYPQIHAYWPNNLITFCTHYITLFVVITLVFCVWYIDKKNFFINIIAFASFILKLSLFLYYVYFVIGNDPTTFPLFDNINNFGCVLAGGVLVVLFDKSLNKLWKCILLASILFALYYNDSKLALFGGIMEIGMFVYYRFSNVISLKHIVLPFLLIISIIGAYYFFSSSFVINGYDMYGLIMEPIQSIFEGNFFPTSDSSITYRANCIIGIFLILFHSLGIGVGPGNTGLILQTMLPNLGSHYDKDFVSSHIWWFEVMADIGWIVIIPMILIFIKQFRAYLSLKSSSSKLFSQIFIISFPLWSMSASGLYTEFYSIMLLTASYILYKEPAFSIK